MQHRYPCGQFPSGTYICSVTEQLCARFKVHLPVHLMESQPSGRSINK